MYEQIDFSECSRYSIRLSTEKLDFARYIALKSPFLPLREIAPQKRFTSLADRKQDQLCSTDYVFGVSEVSSSSARKASLDTQARITAVVLPHLFNGTYIDNLRFSMSTSGMANSRSYFRRAAFCSPNFYRIFGLSLVTSLRKIA